MSKYQLWSHVLLEDGSYSMPEAMIQKIYAQLVKEGRLRATFPGWKQIDYGNFLTYMRHPRNHMVFVVDTEKAEFVFMAWINNIKGHVGYSHFTGMGSNTYRQEIGELILDYWNQTRSVALLIGMIPSRNLTAIKLAEKLGYKKSGVVPKFGYDAITNEKIETTVLYYDMEEMR